MKRLLPCLAGLLALSLRADFIEFRNGGKIEGVIVGETDTDVTIKTGPGSATFKKAQLRSIFRDNAANAVMLRTWQNEHFANPEFVPPALQGLAEQFRELTTKQSAALSAQRLLQQQRQEASGREAELERIKTQQIAIAARLAAPDAKKNAAEYNRLVGANNDLVARYTLVAGRRERLAALDETNRAAIASYLTALGRFRAACDEARARRPADEASRVFLAGADERLAAMTSTLEETRIPLADTPGGHAIVSARINNRGEARLLVDTGASVVSLSGAAAARLGLTWSDKSTAKVRLADGTQIEVHPVLIDTMTVAGSRLDAVRAIVIPDAPAEDVDGLLGMSFLREFDVQIDTARHQIVLRRLPPAK